MSRRAIFEKSPEVIIAEASRRPVTFPVRVRLFLANNIPTILWSLILTIIAALILTAIMRSGYVDWLPGM